MLQPKRAESILQTTEAVERWECDVWEHEQRFGKTLDEDVKKGVFLALAPSQVQNHCHLNSHILQSYAQVRTMLFDNCRAQADTAAGDVVPMDLSMLGKCQGKKGKGDKKGKGKGKCPKSESSKLEKDTDEDKKGKGKGKGKANAKTTKHLPGHCLVCKAWQHAKKDCWWSESAKSLTDTVSLAPAANNTTEPPITGMLIQFDGGETVPANPAQWLYSVTKRELSREEFLIDSGAATSVCQHSLVWNSGQPLDTSSQRPATRRFACAHDTVSTLRVTFRMRPKTLDCRDQSYRLDKSATEASSSRSAELVERYSTSSLATALSCNVLVECIG